MSICLRTALKWQLLFNNKLWTQVDKYHSSLNNSVEFLVILTLDVILEALSS